MQYRLWAKLSNIAQLAYWTSTVGHSGPVLLAQVAANFSWEMCCIRTINIIIIIIVVAVVVVCFDCRLLLVSSSSSLWPIPACLLETDVSWTAKRGHVQLSMSPHASFRSSETDCLWRAGPMPVCGLNCVNGVGHCWFIRCFIARASFNCATVVFMSETVSSFDTCSYGCFRCWTKFVGEIWVRVVAQGNPPCQRMGMSVVAFGRQFLPLRCPDKLVLFGP